MDTNNTNHPVDLNAENEEILNELEQRDQLIVEADEAAGSAEGMNNRGNHSNEVVEEDRKFIDDKALDIPSDSIVS